MMAFTTPQTVRLTGLSARTLRYWEQTGVFRATFVDERPLRPYRRIYTFADIVGLRTLYQLRRVHRVDLQQLREVGEYLRMHDDKPWTSIRFGVEGKSVIFLDPVSGKPISGKPLGQQTLLFEVEPIARAAEEDAAEMRKRDAADIGRVTRHRNVMSNAWVLAGTRIPTAAIWSFHEDGHDAKRILQAYPDLTEADIFAAIEHEGKLRDAVAA